MATHSSILAWKIPWTEKPGGLQSMGSQSQTQLTLSHRHTHFIPIFIIFRESSGVLSSLNGSQKLHNSHLTIEVFRTKMRSHLISLTVS